MITKDHTKWNLETLQALLLADQAMYVPLMVILFPPRSLGLGGPARPGVDMYVCI